jgi:hypothetical protein
MGWCRQNQPNSSCVLLRVAGWLADGAGDWLRQTADHIHSPKLLLPPDLGKKERKSM